MTSTCTASVFAPVNPIIKLTFVLFWGVPVMGLVELLVGEGWAKDEAESIIKHKRTAPHFIRMTISFHVRCCRKVRRFATLHQAGKNYHDSGACEFNRKRPLELFDIHQPQRSGNATGRDAALHRRLRASSHCITELATLK
jgi:hypothetical protein